MGLTVYDVEIPTNLDSLEVFGTDMDDLTVFGTLVWQKQKYYFIAFASNGGIGSMPQQTMPVGVATALTVNRFARTGYLFYGWSPSASGSRKYTDGQKVTDIVAAGETATLYALWDAITYYVRYNANGGSGSMGNQQLTYDVAARLSSNAFSKTGYLFASWQGSVAGDTMVFSDAQEVVNLATEGGEVVDLHALWTAITWYVRYHANGGSGNMTNSTHKYDIAKALTSNAFTKSESSFIGWATVADGAVVYTDGQSVKNLRSTHGDVLNLYAVWKANPFYVIQNSAWIGITPNWTCTYGEGVNWTVAEYGCMNSSDEYSVFSSISWNTKGLTNVRVKISQNGGSGNVVINGTNLGNLMDKAWGEYTGTLSGSTCNIDMGLNSGSWCYIEELYFY